MEVMNNLLYFSKILTEKRCFKCRSNRLCYNFKSYAKKSCIVFYSWFIVRFFKMFFL